jgi:hypothetical protein
MPPNENPSQVSALPFSNNMPSDPSCLTYATFAPSTSNMNLDKPDEKKGFFRRFIDAIKGEMRDLSYMEVIVVNYTPNPEIDGKDSFSNKVADSKINNNETAQVPITGKNNQN